MDAVKRVDHDHQKAIKEQSNLDKEEASARNADQEAQDKLNKASEEANKKADEAREAALTKAKSETKKSRDEAVAKAESELKKFQKELEDAEKKTVEEHDKEYKSGETLAAKRHALAKKLIETRFIALKRKFGIAEKNAKAEAAEILKGGKDHATDLLFEATKSINKYRDAVIDAQKARLDEGKANFDAIKTKSTKELKRAEEVAKHDSAQQTTSFETEKKSNEVNLKALVEKAKKEEKDTAEEFTKLKKAITDGQAEGEKLLKDAKKKYETDKKANEAKIEKAEADKKAGATEIGELNKKVLETRDKISETNRNSWFAESEVTKEQNRQDTLTTQIEQLKKDIEARKNAIAERKLIEAEEEKNKPPEGDFECPDGTKVFDLTNCPDGGGPVEKARAEAAKKLKETQIKKQKADAEKREKDSVKEMEDALKELEKALTESKVALKTAEATTKKGKGEVEKLMKEINGHGKKAEETAEKIKKAATDGAEAEHKLRVAESQWSAQQANHDAAMEGFKNRMYTLEQSEQQKMPYLKQNVVEAEGTLKLTIANLENTHKGELLKINQILDKEKADSKATITAAEDAFKALEKEVKALQKEATDKAKQMEGRAKTLEKFHIDLATKRSEELLAKAKDIKEASLIKAENAKETQLKAAKLKFESDKTILNQEKQQMDNKALALSNKNKAEVLKEKAYRKLEDVRLDAANQRVVKLEAAVKASKLHLQAKLKMASTLQAKAMKMEGKEKVQPDVIHQIIVNIKAATMMAIQANKDLKALEARHEVVTHDYALLHDKIYAARSRRAERTRELVAKVETDKAEFFSDVSTNTSARAESFYKDAESGIEEMRTVIEDSVNARKQGKHLVGPLNSLKNRIEEALGKGGDTSLTTSFEPMDKALAEANVAAGNTEMEGDHSSSKALEAKETSDKYYPYSKGGENSIAPPQSTVDSLAPEVNAVARSNSNSNSLMPQQAPEENNAIPE
jgi:hypothetical protein